MKQTRLDLKLPKFRIEATEAVDLKAALSKLGMLSAFSGKRISAAW